MLGEGLIFYSSEEVNIAYNEKKVELHAIIKLRNKFNKDERESLLKLLLGEYYLMKLSQNK